MERAVKGGVVDQSVDPAEALDGLFGHAVAGGDVRHVQMQAKGAVARGLGSRRAVGDVPGDDMGAGLAEASRIFEPQAACGPSDQNDFSGDAHGLVPLRDLPIRMTLG